MSSKFGNRRITLGDGQTEQVLVRKRGKNMNNGFMQIEYLNLVELPAHVSFGSRPWYYLDCAGLVRKSKTKKEKKETFIFM